MKTFDEELTKCLHCGDVPVEDCADRDCIECERERIKAIIRARLDSCPVVLVDVSMTPDKHEYAHAILNSDAYRAFGIEGKEKGE